MKVHVFMTRKVDEENGYTNTLFRLQGVGLTGLIPVRICFNGKPVVAPVMVRQIDKATGKPLLDKDGKELLTEKKDDQGNVIYQELKNENGKTVMRDEEFVPRVDLLSMFSANREEGELCEPVDLIARSCQQKENGDRYAYYLVCGNEEVPIEVVNFSTADKVDWKYDSNRKRLFAIAEKV